MTKQITNGILAIFLFIVLSSTSAVCAPKQLIPCEEIFTRSPILGDHYKWMAKELNAKWSAKPFFTIYFAPAFEPDFAIAIYKQFWNRFTVEKITFTTKYKLESLASLKHPVPTYTNTRAISPRTANSLKEALHIALSKQGFNPAEIEKEKEYLDGTLIFFISADNKCGWPFHVPAPGPAQELLKVSDLLIDYLNGKASEMELNKSANKIIDNKGY